MTPQAAIVGGTLHRRRCWRTSAAPRTSDCIALLDPLVRPRNPPLIVDRRCQFPVTRSIGRGRWREMIALRECDSRLMSGS